MSYLQGTEFPHTAAERNKSIQMHQQSRAAERGHVCVYPMSCELFLDIDTLEGLGRMHAALAQNAYIKSIVNGEPLVKPSPSGKAGRCHVIVFLNKNVDKFERITLQCLLGSDLAREILSYQEAQAGCERPTVFYEKSGGMLAVPPSVPRPDAGLPARPRPCLDPDKMNGAADQSSGYMGGRY
jgi:hypothetical protein